MPERETTAGAGRRVGHHEGRAGTVRGGRRASTTGARATTITLRPLVSCRGRRGCLVGRESAGQGCHLFRQRARADVLRARLEWDRIVLPGAWDFDRPKMQA